jgi:chromosome segregation ATPase
MSGARIDRLEADLHEIRTRFDAIDRKLDSIERTLDELIARIIELEARLDARGIGPDSLKSCNHKTWRAFHEEFPLPLPA